MDRPSSLASLPVVGLCVCLAGCASTRQVATSSTVGPAADAEGDLQHTEASGAEPATDEESLTRRIETLAAQLQNAPDDVEVAIALSASYEAQGRLLTATGSDAAAAFEAGLRAGETALALARSSSPEAVGSAECWLRLNQHGFARAAGFLERVDSERFLLDAFARLSADPSCGPLAQRGLASLLATAIHPQHRDLPRSKATFESLLARDPWDLPAHVAFARAYAVAAQDRAVYEQQLRAIVDRTSGNQGKPIERFIAARAAAFEMRLAPSEFE